jgi:hypothetical protein
MGNRGTAFSTAASPPTFSPLVPVSVSPWSLHFYSLFSKSLFPVFWPPPPTPSDNIY